MSFLTRQEEWKAKHNGKFVLSALEDTVRVWALAGAFTHDQVISECKTKGRILGGGDIGYSEKEKRVGLSAGSGDYGSLPDIVLTDYFQHFGYQVHADMIEKWIRKRTREWFREHDIGI